jgi:2-oxoglutarate ferredoxin oxidoreductase subunit alpha
MPAQGDIMQTRWGTHGDHSIITLYPNSVQENFWMTVHAFNLAERYSTPVILLSDGALAKTREKLILPQKKDIEIIERSPHSKKIFSTGLTYGWNSYPVTTNQQVHEQLITRLNNKIERNREDIIIVEQKFCEDADLIIISYGIVSRPVISAVRHARDNGYNVGYLRLITIWPFAKDHIFELSKNIKNFLVVEMNLGQLYHKVVEHSKGNCNVYKMNKIGGEVPTPEEILIKIKKVI